VSLEDASADVRNHTLHFEVPYLVVGMNDLAACIDTLALLEKDTIEQSPQELDTIAEEDIGSGTEDWELTDHSEGNGVSAGGSMLEETNAEVAGASDKDRLHDQQAGTEAEINGDSQATGGAGAGYEAGTAGQPVGGIRPGAGQRGSDVELDTCADIAEPGCSDNTAKCSGLSGADELADESLRTGIAEPTVAECAEEDVGAGDERSDTASPEPQDQGGADVTAVEARIRGAIETLRDAPPAHLLAVFLFSSCQVCPVLAGRAQVSAAAEAVCSCTADLQRCGKSAFERQSVDSWCRAESCQHKDRSLPLQSQHLTQ
jgi:hypothetical protein